ncbi:Non-specific serine/threonine protein kinase protein [Dioscorea alata]|uniref:Non-specific serine/threonine protein kinase protein n=2 Tax=Dioscorea alata TaxID=55571 RepID=A0ACB7VL80_DIOAL|nr:Non-specific serine/threonine protein kinase protein [Dioscorea alata]
MGNKIARTTQMSASEYYLHELPSSYNLVLIEVLGSGRFFKSILCKHDEGLLLVKVYFKRGDPLDLKEHERKLLEIREIFRKGDHPHVWPFQFWLETDKAAYLLRQYFFSNLHDRLSMLPKLSLIEKKWLAFQLLCAVKHSHENGVCHGDIKCENVLVTSWNWLYLADFASFKPTYIPDDDPSDFSFFFDTGGRRRCYLAPERFYEHGGVETQIPSDATLKPSMDIFSLGCVIAELFLGGQPLFELSQLLAYRRGQYDPMQSLEKIQDAGIRRMILHMIQLDPESRLSCESYLQSFASDVFPSYFSPCLHSVFSCLVPLDSDKRVEVIQRAFQEIHKQMISDRSTLDTSAESFPDSSLGRNDLARHMEPGRQNMTSVKHSLKDGEKLANGLIGGHFELVSDLNSLLKKVQQRNKNSHSKAMVEGASNAFLHHSGSDPARYALHAKHYKQLPSNELIQNSKQNKDETLSLERILKSNLIALISGYDIQSDTYNIPVLPREESQLSCEGMVLIASLLCSCIRSVKQPQLRRVGVLLLKSSSLYIDDEDRLQHVLPYVIAMLSDPAAIVRCAALETLCDILPLVQEFPPSDAKIFPEYILPMLSMLPEDPEESVRICYASNIFKIAFTAYRLLLQSKKSNEAGFRDKSLQKSQSPTAESHVNKDFDTQLSQLRRAIADVVQELVMGSKQTPTIRRALLQDIGHLCFFFGQRQSNDFLLPILPAFLNDRDEQLRTVFYGQIIFVCYFVGQRSVEEYLLPYIEQALSDSMEAVIVNALECLTMLCRSGYLRKRILLDMIDRGFPLLCYPIQWVRRSAVTFIAASSESLGPVDTYVYLSQVLRPILQREPASLSSEASLLSCLKPPVSKLMFYQALDNARNSDMLERQRKIWYNSAAYTNQWESNETNKTAGDSNQVKSSSGKDSSGQNDSYAAMQKTSIPSTEEPAKLKTGSSVQNAGPLDGRDTHCSEKLQFSGFVNPHVSGGDSFLCDGPSEGIPLYSVFADKHTTGAVPSGFDSLLYGNPLGGASSMRWLDPVNKSLTMSSSVPPKLISGSFYNISSSSKVFKASHDNAGKDNGQSSYITSRFQDATISETLKGSSSIAGDDGAQSDASGFSSFGRASSSAPDIGWRPRGVLVAHMQEHRSGVNDIAVSNDHSFFVTASHDSTVKVWDTRKLEKDISFRSRLTYSLDGSRALCTTMLGGTTQVAAGSSDGKIHLFSVDCISRGLGSVAERYSGIADIKRKDVGQGAILSLLNCSAADSSVGQTILYSTLRCGIHLWDTRADGETWIFRIPPEEGYVSSLVMGQCGNWFVSGSSRGVLTLWDMRFLLPVNTWHYPVVCPVERICLLIAPTSSGSAMTRPLVYVAAGCNEVSLWNAENGSCHQVLKVASSESDTEFSHIPRASARPSSKSSSKQDTKRNSGAKYRIDELNDPSSRHPGIRSMLPLPGGDLLTGGTDLKIRYWDNASPARSFTVCGPSTKGVPNEDYYDVSSSFGVQVMQEKSRRVPLNKLTQKALLATAATDSAGCHRDSILSLATVKLNQRLLISSSRDGAVKVWK